MQSYRATDLHKLEGAAQHDVHACSSIYGLPGRLFDFKYP